MVLRRTAGIALLPRCLVFILIFIRIVAVLRHGDPLLPAPPLGRCSDVSFSVRVDDGLQAPLQRRPALAGLQARFRLACGVWRRASNATTCRQKHRT